MIKLQDPRFGEFMKELHRLWTSQYRQMPVSYDTLDWGVRYQFAATNGAVLVKVNRDGSLLSVHFWRRGDPSDDTTPLWPKTAADIWSILEFYNTLPPLRLDEAALPLFALLAGHTQRDRYKDGWQETCWFAYGDDYGDYVENPQYDQLRVQFHPSAWGRLPSVATIVHDQDDEFHYLEHITTVRQLLQLLCALQES